MLALLEEGVRPERSSRSSLGSAVRSRPPPTREAKRTPRHPRLRHQLRKLISDLHPLSWPGSSVSEGLSPSYGVDGRWSRRTEASSTPTHPSSRWAELADRLKAELTRKLAGHLEGSSSS